MVCPGQTDRQRTAWQGLRRVQALTPETHSIEGGLKDSGLIEAGAVVSYRSLRKDGCSFSAGVCVCVSITISFDVKSPLVRNPSVLMGCLVVCEREGAAAGVVAQVDPVDSNVTFSVVSWCFCQSDESKM